MNSLPSVSFTNGQWVIWVELCIIMYNNISNDMIITIELIYILVVFGVVVAQMENTTTTANTLKHYPETDWYHDNRLVSNIAWRRWISRIGTIQRAIHTQHRWNQTFDWAHAVQVLDSIFSLYPLFSSSFISFHFFFTRKYGEKKLRPNYTLKRERTKMVAIQQD